MKIFATKLEKNEELFTTMIYKVSNPDLLVGYYVYPYPVGVSVLSEHVCKLHLAKYAENWFPISLNEMDVNCQAELARTMPDFPWNESFWENEDDFKEWDNPVTLKGKIEKSIRDYTYFGQWYKSLDFKIAVDEQIELFNSEFLKKELVKFNYEWYVAEYEYNPEDGPFSTLKRVSEEKAQELLQALKK